MKKISSDYIATEQGKCEICGRQIFEGMYVFTIELRGGRKGVAHSTCACKCEVELKSKPQSKSQKRG